MQINLSQTRETGRYKNREKPVLISVESRLLYFFRQPVKICVTWLCVRRVYGTLGKKRKKKIRRSLSRFFFSPCLSVRAIFNAYSSSSSSVAGERQRGKHA